MISQIVQLNNTVYGNSVFVKRDDLLPVALGGNKARISECFIADLKKKQNSCVIGYGSIRSNMCRTLALLAKKENIPCYIISPLEEGGQCEESFNHVIVKSTGARVVFCEKSKVSEAIADTIEEIKSQGQIPYYVNGDKYGKGNESVPVEAYYNAYQEILHQQQSLGTYFDYVFLATGTGMTQAGLLVGCEAFHGREHIIGISIARERARAIECIRTYCDAFTKEKMLPTVPISKILVDDSFLCGGYGKYNKTIENVILETLHTEGIPLDPTYTGKAFQGMKQYLKTHRITNKTILFLHTGGTPLFFDYCKKMDSDITTSIVEFEVCNSADELVRFLRDVDRDLPTPLSNRVDLIEYSHKVLRFGNCLVAKIDGVWTSVALYYRNDIIHKRGYLTLLATKKAFRGKGIAGQLMDHVEQDLRQHGISRLGLDTDICNTKAVSFYSRRGYCIVAVNEKLQMTKEL